MATDGAILLEVGKISYLGETIISGSSLGREIMMVLYEIMAVVDAAFADDFYEYLAAKHIGDLLATGLFERATLGRRGNEFRVIYYARSRVSLDEYFRDHAERLRAEVTLHFPSGVNVTRAEWEDVRILTPRA